MWKLWHWRQHLEIKAEFSRCELQWELLLLLLLLLLLPRPPPPLHLLHGPLPSTLNFSVIMRVRDALYVLLQMDLVLQRVRVVVVVWSKG